MGKSFYRFAALSLVPVVLCLVAGHAGTQAAITSYDDRAAFARNSTGLNVVDFDGLAPNSGFTNYKAPQIFATGGFEFRLSGGGRFGPGYISLVGPWYYAGPIYETGTGAKLTWAPPNQPGDAYLEVALPAGVNAVGADLWTAQPYASAVEVTATSIDGTVQTMKVNTQPRPAVGFAGFVSDAPTRSLRFAIPKGQVGLMLDNLTYGRSTRNGSRSSVSTSAQPNGPGESEAKQAV